MDSQTVKAPGAEERGYDAGKRVVGRKRHIAVGRLLMVNLTPGDIFDSAGAQMIVEAIRRRWPYRLRRYTSGGQSRLPDFVLEIIQRRDGVKGFEVQPRRWVVDWTFGWMIRWRRLVRDYERRIDVSKAMIFVAMSTNLLRRNAHPCFSKQALSATRELVTRKPG